MKILDCLEKENIFVRFEVKDKKDFFENAVPVVVNHHPDLQQGNVDKVEKEVLSLYLEREKTMTTGIGQKIAIPHILYEKCNTQKLFIFKLKHPIDFKALDKKPVELVIMIVGKQEESNMHYLQMLAKLSRLLKKDAFVDKLLDSQTPDEICSVFKDHERR